MFKSFQTRLVVLFAALFIVVQALTYFSVYFATSNNLEEQAKKQLDYSSNVFNRTLSAATEKRIAEANIFSTDYGFRAAVTTDDQATVLSALENFSLRVDADRTMLFSMDNEIIADIADDKTATMQRNYIDELIAVADEYGEATTFVNIGGKIYQFTVVPVLAPVPVAWVGVGVLMDGNDLLEIQKTLPSGVDITFVEIGNNNNFNAVETTLMQEIFLDIDPVINNISGAMKNEIFDVGNYQFMAQSTPLPSAVENNGYQVLLTYSLDAAYEPYEPLVFALVLLLGLGLISLIGGSVTVAKSVSKPLKKLAKAARMIEVGQYSKVEEIKQKDEIGQLANHFNQMVTGIREREDKIIYQAEHDLVTGLPNRVNLEKYLNILLANHKDTGQVFSVIQITIDQFDDVRNTLGYETARKLMKKISRRLLKISSNNNFVSRLSTVNFCIVSEGAGAANAMKFAKCILADFEKPFIVDDFTIDNNIKVGIACCPDHAEDIDVLIQRANIAVHNARDTIDQISVYDPDKDEYDADSLSLMGDFRKSLEAGHVKFYYQPKINLELNKVTHVEALVRWIHPERGFIPPDDFIMMAEQTGHIKHLTDWGLEEVIKQSREWIDEEIDVKIAINLSARDLSNKRLPEYIIGLLEEYKVPRSRLVLEITESAIMKDPDLAMGVLNALDGHGLLMSIDDYGTGYSSMSYLKQLPVKEIKIDKSFVLDLATNKEDEILVRSTIELGHNLGFKVTAEGVEDQVSLEKLRSYGCDLIQGFHVGKPLPLADLYDFFKNSPYGLNDKVVKSEETKIRVIKT